jgi:hypothetical protein
MATRLEHFSPLRLASALVVAAGLGEIKEQVIKGGHEQSSWSV